MELLKEWLLGGAAALMNARSVLIRDLLGKTPSSCASWKLLHLLVNVEHSVGYPRPPPQHPCKSWLLINSITEGGGLQGEGCCAPWRLLRQAQDFQSLSKTSRGPPVTQPCTRCNSLPSDFAQLFKYRVYSECEH